RREQIRLVGPSGPVILQGALQLPVGADARKAEVCGDGHRFSSSFLPEAGPSSHGGPGLSGPTIVAAVDAEGEMIVSCAAVERHPVRSRPRRPPRTAAHLAVVALVAAVLSVGAAPRTVPATAPAAAPRLIVLVVIDQFRADYLTRFHHRFGPGGFNRLEREGA